jgi:hypothetical protein
MELEGGHGETEVLRGTGAVSAIGTKQTFVFASHVSAFGGKADIAVASQNIRL